MPIQETGALDSQKQPKPDQYAGELDLLSADVKPMVASSANTGNTFVARSRWRLGLAGTIAAIVTLLVGAGATGLYMYRQSQGSPVAIETEAALPTRNLAVSSTDWLFTVNGALEVSGLSSLEQLSVVSDVSIGGMLTVAGNAIFGQEISANTIRTNGLVVGGNAVILNNLEAANVSGTFSGSYEGDGRGLRNVDALSLLGKPLSYFEDASHLLTGTVNDARLSSNVALRDAENLFTATNRFSQDLLIQGAVSAATASFTDAVSATVFTQNGFAVCDTSGNCSSAASNMFVQGGNTFGASAVLGTQDGFDLIFKTSNTNRLVIAANGAVSVIGELTATALNGNGLGITDLNAGHITTGQLSDGRLSTNVVLKDANNTLSGDNIFTSPTNSFTGEGSGLTQVDADYLGGQDSGYYTNADHITTGTLGDLRLSTNVTLQGNSFNGANQLVQLMASGALPALDGSNISNVNAGLLQGHAADYFTNADNMVSGTLHDDRLSGNIARLDIGNTFTGAVNNFATVSAAELLQNNHEVCDISGNCAGAGGGVTTGGGTTGYLALFTDGQIIGDSIVSQASDIVTVTGTLAANFIQGDGTDIVNLDAGQLVTGIAAVGVGGTGATSFTNNGVIIGSASGVLRATAAGTSGQCLAAVTGGAPIWTDCDSAAGGATPGGAAGGDLSGTYPNPTVSGLNGTALAVSSLSGGEFLLYNGANWVNTALSGDITATAAGVATIGNGAVTNAKLANSSLAVTAGTGLSGGGMVSLGGTTSLQVVYGTTNASAVAGNTTLVCPAGSGNLTGGGNTVTLGAGGVCGNLSVVATPAFTGLTLTNALAVAYGGTGATSAAGARTNLGAAASGVNNDITSLSAITSIANAGADMSVGNTGRALTLQGNAATVLRAVDGGFMTTLGFATPTANVNYTLPTAAAGSYYICTSVGNCAGTGGGVTTGGGTASTIAMFTDNGIIGDSLLSQVTLTSTVTVAGTLVATALQGSGADVTNLNGTNITTGTVGVSVGGTGRTSFTSNGIVYGNGSSLQVTAAGTSGQCLAAVTGGAPIWTDCDSAAGGATPGGAAGGDLSGTYPNPTVARLYGTPLSINTLTSGQMLIYDGTSWSNRSLSGDMTVSATGVVTIANGAVTNVKLANSSLTVTAGTGLSGGGVVALGGSASLSVTYGSTAGTAAQGNTGLSFTGTGNLAGTVSGTAGGGFTSNTLAVVSNPTFGGLVTASAGLTASSVSFSGNLTQTGTTGVITLGSLSTGIVQSNASGVVTSGNIDRNSALLTSQTSVANGGTGATTAAAARTNLSAAVRGTNNDITSLTAITAVGNTAADLAVGSTGRALTLQGNASTILAASANGFTTTLGFATPSADVTYLLPTVAAGSYNICTSSGNCGYAPSTGSGSYINNQYAGAQTGSLWISGTAQTGAIISASINSTGALQTAGVTRITASGELQNVTANASMLTTGTLSDARLSATVAIDRGNVLDGTDFNTITTQGTYRVGGGTYTNFPSGVYAFGTLVVSASSNSVTQMYFPHASGVTGNWTRTKWNAADWNIWTVFWGNTNDGAGSGLDADYLDGKSSTDFAAATGSNSYIQNGTTQQAGASFNISGTGAVGGTFYANGTAMNIRLRADGTTWNDGGVYANSTGNIYLANWDGTRGILVDSAGGITAMGAASNLNVQGTGTSVLAGSLKVSKFTYLGSGSANLDPSALPVSVLTTLQNSMSMLVGVNRTAGGGEIDFIANRGGGNIGGFRFYDYSNSGVLTSLMSLSGGGDLAVTGIATVSGAGIYNSRNYQIIETNTADFLRINQGNSYTGGTAAYGPWSFGSGGVSIGSAWNGSNYATGELNVQSNIRTNGAIRIDSVGNLTNINDATLGGRLNVTGGTSTAYLSAPIEITTTATPRIAFHWPGVIASQLGIDTSGLVRTYNNPGTGYERFGAHSYEVQGAVVIDGNRNLTNIVNGGLTGNLNVAGNVGIGIASPAYKLDVVGDINSSTALRVNGVAVCTASGCTASGGGSYIQNTTTEQIANYNISGNGRVGGYLTVGQDATFSGSASFAGNVDINANLQVNLSSVNNQSRAVCHTGTSVTITNVTLARCSNTPQADYAEYYPTRDNVEAADLVATTQDMFSYELKSSDEETGEEINHGTKQIPFLKKAQLGDALIGVVSTAPAKIIGAEIPSTVHRSPIALIGRVPVKVNNEGGQIAVGDKLSLSSVAGVATKAYVAGSTFGVALSSLDSAAGIIMVYLQTGYYDPLDANHLQAKDMTLGGHLLVGGSAAIDGHLNVSGHTMITELTVTGSATIGGDLTVQGLIRAHDIEVNGHLITAGESPNTLIGIAAGQDAIVKLAGNDTSGTITITTGAAGTVIGEQAVVEFAEPYVGRPRIMITGNDGASAGAQVYPANINETGFSVMFNQAPTPGTTYTFTYFVVQ